MNQLPMTVVGGYLGAGKTTLINQILAADHGLRILVLVNDFGAINIDADLLISADKDTIELANGCVCCTMGADLFLAIGDVLDRRPRPDHLIIEASGIADPLRIANVARAEPELLYSGIVTVVDGLQFDQLSRDPLIEAQIKDQVACADLIVLSKTDIASRTKQSISKLNQKATIVASNSFDIEQTMVALPMPGETTSRTHPAYTKWSYVGRRSFQKSQLTNMLSSRPKSLSRVKGRVRGTHGAGYLVQVSGSDITISETTQPEICELVGIGLKARLSVEDCDAWWDGATMIDS